MPAVAIGVGLVAVAGATTYAAVSADKNASKANKAANAARDAEMAYRAKELAFAQEQWNTWKQDFGGIQEEVAEFYKNLTADGLRQQYQMAGTEASNTLLNQFDTQLKQLENNFAKAGMTNTGASASAQLSLQNQLLSSQAQNNFQTQQMMANADNVVMGQKAGWVQQGEALRQNATQAMLGAYQGYSNSYNQTKQQYQQAAEQYKQQVTNSIVSGMNTIGGGLMGFGTGMISNGYSMLGEKLYDKDGRPIYYPQQTTTTTQQFVPASGFNLAINDASTQSLPFYTDFYNKQKNTFLQYGVNLNNSTAPFGRLS